MFSFRWKSRRSIESPPSVARSPSLPELPTQRVQWPKDLVNASSVPQNDTPPVPVPPKGKPADGSIASLYMSPPPPPSAFDTRKQFTNTRTRQSQRKARSPMSFNVMVVGAQSTGKTSLLRLLLDTADISPTATPEQKTAMDKFLRGPPKRTESIRSISVEICESRFDRVLLSAIDTPGLDLQQGHELNLERQVTSIIKYLEAQFSDTLSEENKVIRQSMGDQHVHLCIYMIDPKSVMTASLRRALPTLPDKMRSATSVHRPPDLSSFSDDTTSNETDDDPAGELTMSPADIRVIRRLSTRVNVLPVLAHADSMTDESLADVKRAVRRELRAAGLDFGVFEPPEEEGQPPANSEATTNGNGAAHVESEEDEVEERKSRSFIKLRPSRYSKGRSSSRSRTRVTLSELAAVETAEPNEADTESVASVRFSAGFVSKTNVGARLPFAVISPEQVKRRRPLKASTAPTPAANRTSTHTESGRSVAEDEVVDSAYSSPVSPVAPSVARGFPYLAGPPADLKGVFVRRFRWGTIDVLNPEHCDFAAMRTAVLSTHMKLLKIRTKEVLYEKYRTERLLVKRATKNITEDGTRKLLADLGL